MKALSSLKLFLACLFVILYCLPAQVNAQNSDGNEEEKFWKNQAKRYSKDPVLLKNEVETFKDTISYWKGLNKSLEQGGGVVGGTSPHVTDSLITVLEDLNAEMTGIREQRMQILDAYSAAEKVGEMGISTGLIYRLMLGDAPRAHTENNFGNYVIGSFRTEQSASKFRKHLVAIGMSGPINVVAYINGNQVSMDEARAYRNTR